MSMIIKRQKVYSKKITKAANRAIREKLGYIKPKTGTTLYKDIPVGVLDSINNKATTEALAVGANLGQAAPGHRKSLRYYKRRQEYGDHKRLQKIWDHGKRDEYPLKDRIEFAKNIINSSRINEINNKIREKQIAALTK